MKNLEGHEVNPLNHLEKGEVARFPYTKISENWLKSKAIQGGLRFFYGIQEICNRA